MLFGTNSGVFVLVRWAPVVLFGGSLVLVLLSLRVVILMGFIARWVFSYVPLWGHLILANPDLAAIQGRTAAGARVGHPRGSGTKLCIVFEISMDFFL